MSGVCVHGAYSYTWECMHFFCKHDNLPETCRHCQVEETLRLRSLAKRYGLPWPEEES